MSGRRPIGAVDHIWLQCDQPTNLMVIDSLMFLSEPVDVDRLTRVLDRRLVARYPVFHQRPVLGSTPLTPAYWEDDPSFVLRRHVHKHTLPAPGDDRALQRFVEKKMQTPLDRERALWEVHVIQGYGDGCVVMCRFHHALADGIALAEVLLSLTDDQPDDDLREDDEAPGELEPAADEAPESHGLIGSAASLVTGSATSLARSAFKLVADVPAALHPAYAVEAVTLARQTGLIADKLLLSHNPESPLSQAPGVAKRAVWSEPRPLPDVKRIGRLAGATVNDVLVGAVSGAISHYLHDRGVEPHDMQTMVPVNLRPKGEPLPRELGNKFALVMLPLPTAPLAPLQRLSEAKSRMDSIKHSPEAVLTFGVINAIGRTNPDVARHVIDFFAAKAIGVTTNVAGPLAGRYVAGTRIDGVLGWVPGSGGHTLGVCIFSYNDVVRVGFKADAEAVTDPEKLVHAFDDEMDTLVRVASAV